MIFDAHGDNFSLSLSEACCKGYNQARVVTTFWQMAADYLHANFFFKAVKGRYSLKHYSTILYEYHCNVTLPQGKNSPLKVSTRLQED
jgi:hypothetical protein